MIRPTHTEGHAGKPAWPSRVTVHYLNTLFRSSLKWAMQIT